MIAPHFARSFLLKQAIDEAMTALGGELIDSVNVVGDRVTVHAGAQRVVMTFAMSHGETLGSWSWHFTRIDVERLSLLARVRRLFR